MSLDTTFTYLNSNRCLIDIIDQEWASDRLYDEEIDMKEVDQSLLIEKEFNTSKQDMWSDFALDQLKDD